MAARSRVSAVLQRLTTVALVLAAECGLAVPGAAHELGTSRVSVTLTRDGVCMVEITADAASLLARLQAASGRARERSVARDEYTTRIAALGSTLLGHADLRVDGAPAPLRVDAVQLEAITDAESELRPPVVVVRLRGAVPADARTLTWGYDLTSASYALTITPADGAPHTEWLEGGQVGEPIALAATPQVPARLATAHTYFGLGFTHILPKGLDHILFVLGIFLFGRGLRPMLWQISAFTVAHSITLGLAMYGLVSLPASIVEPLIALSIVYVAFENLVVSELKPWRVVLVFAFGLLHGLGFAGVLRELALPRGEFVTGLVTFNLGVEAGQLTVIAGATLLVAHWARHQERYRRLVVVPGSCAIALVGAYWTLSRLFVL